MSQREEPELPTPNATSSNQASSSTSAREVQRRQLMIQSKKQEAEVQKETETLIRQMHEQASLGEIPEYGKKIIDVLLHYQGNSYFSLCFTYPTISLLVYFLL